MWYNRRNRNPSIPIHQAYHLSQSLVVTFRLSILNCWQWGFQFHRHKWYYNPTCDLGHVALFESCTIAFWYLWWHLPPGFHSSFKGLIRASWFSISVLTFGSLYVVPLVQLRRHMSDVLALHRHSQSHLECSRLVSCLPLKWGKMHLWLYIWLATFPLSDGYFAQIVSVANLLFNRLRRNPYN